MKHLPCLLLPLLLATGCTRAYWVDRGRDALDVVPLGVGLGFGAKAQVGPVGTGLGIIADVYTTRGGIHEVVQGHPGITDMEAHAVVLGTSPYYGVRKGTTCLVMVGAHLPSSVLYDQDDFGLHDLYPLTEVGAVVGLGVSLRVAVNPGELIDLLVGFTTLDLYDDDVESKDAARAEPVPRKPEDSI